MSESLLLPPRGERRVILIDYGDALAVVGPHCGWIVDGVIVASEQSVFLTLGVARISNNSWQAVRQAVHIEARQQANRFRAPARTGPRQTVT
jgi:hypothetical protein